MKIIVKQCSSCSKDHDNIEVNDDNFICPETQQEVFVSRIIKE